MKRRLIKKYKEGKNVTWDSSKYPLYKELPLRNYYWAPILDDTELIDYTTGQSLNPGDAVLIDPRTGKPLTPNSDEAIRDYLTLTNLFEGLANLPEVTVTYNKDKKDTTTKVGKSYDDYLKEKSNTSVATSALWEEQAKLNFEANDLIRLKLEKRAADRKAYDLTPGVGSLALLGVVGGLAAWNPLAFMTSLGAAKIGEMTVDYPFLLRGYKSFGDWLFQGTNAPEWLKENSNPGTYLSGGFGYNVAKLYLKSIGLSAAEAGIRKGLLQSAAESFNLFHGKLLSTVGDINEGSTYAAATNLFKSDPEFLNRFKKVFSHMILSGGESSGLYGTINLGLPKNVQDYIMHNIIGRRIIAGNKSNWWTGNVQNRAKEVMNEVKVGEFPNLLFEDAGDGFSGLYNPDNNFIAVNIESKKFTPDYIKKHEGDHLIDKTIPLTKEQENILAKALDEDFLDLPNKPSAGTLKGYLHMDAERTTTIHDAVRRLLSEELLKWNIDLQNKLIDKLSDEKIFKALEQSNGYGRRYVEFLRLNNGLTPEKANQIRSAMKILCTTGNINEGSILRNLTSAFQKAWQNLNNGSK